MKAGKTLTHSAIVGAKPKEKPYKLSDTDRLYVLVTVAGKKYWKWNYRLDEKDCTYTLGTFPDLGLSAAREKRVEIAKLVEHGVHPADHDQDQILKAAQAKADTVWLVAEEWIAAKGVNWTPYYRRQVESLMARYVRDTPFGKRPIQHVSTAEVFQLVKAVANRTKATGVERKATGAPASATLLRQWLGAVFRYAIGSGRAKSNPVSDLKNGDVITKPPVKHNRNLSIAELRQFCSSLEKFSAYRATGIAIELLMLTFVRTQELRAATWDEFDLEKAAWRIPAERMKRKDQGDHLVPLSKQAVALLKELQEITGISKSGPKWLFRNTRRDTECMSATTINRALERMGFCGKGTIGFSAHGFRGTASTHLHEMKFLTQAIEAQLAHKERNASKASYNQAEYVPERTAMMQQWADYLDEMKAGNAADIADAPVAKS